MTFTVCILCHKRYWSCASVGGHFLTLIEFKVHLITCNPGARFSKVPTLFGWHSSLCIFKAKASRSTKLCTYPNFYSLYNIRKDQLHRISGSQFYEWLFGPEKSSGLSRNRPLNMSGSCHRGRRGFLSFLIVKAWPQRQLIRFTLSSFYVRTGSSNCVCRKSGRRGQDVTWPSDHEKDGRSCARWVQVNTTGTRLGWRSPKVGARLERLVYLMLKLLDLILNSVIE